MHRKQRRGDAWSIANLRELLFMHYAHESGASSGILAVKGFTRNAVDAKLRKMRKELDAEVMNFATNRTDCDERNAIQQACACLPAVSIFALTALNTCTLQTE